MSNNKSASLGHIQLSKFDGHLTNLHEIPQAPKGLYMEGALPAADMKLLAVVGSRKHSSYGKEVCEYLIDGLRGQDISIVSGLAIGMDTIAHKAALEAGLHTMALPGSGLNRSVLHPSSNRKLADEIVESGGCLLSEYDPDCPAGVHTFPRRNRIMAGLAQAVLVVEAGERSGTLITARLATEYNKDVLAVPGPIFNPMQKGVNQLLHLGATPITSSTDILEALGLDVDGSNPTQISLDLSELSKDEQKIIKLLSIEPLPRDELIRKLALPTDQASTLLIQLELKGVVIESLGQLRLT